MAFELKAQTGFESSHWGVSVLGIAGSEPTRYIGAAITLNKGWFGTDCPE